MAKALNDIAYRPIHKKLLAGEWAAGQFVRLPVETA
jgi:hypothetical protein